MFNKFYFHLLNIILLLYSTMNAQLPYEFTLKARNANNGSAHDVAVGADGTIFLANGTDGLRVYNYEGSSLNNIAYIGVEYSYIENVALESSNIIFSTIWAPLGAGVHPKPSLNIYNFDGDSLRIIKTLAGCGWDTIIQPCGFRAFASYKNGVIFISEGGFGVSAYIYKDTTFTYIAGIGNIKDVNNLAIGPDGTIFIACEQNGLYAYSYKDSSFKFIDHINDGGSAQSVAVGENGTIFLANGSDGLRAYTFDGSFLINTAHIGIIERDMAIELAVGPNGTIYLVNSRDGLRAYSYDGSSFSNTAHIDPGDGATDVAIRDDGTIFFTTATEGLFVYTYSAPSAIGDVPLSIPLSCQIFQNYPNPFNPSTVIKYQISKNKSQINSNQSINQKDKGLINVQLKVYDILGREVATLVNEKQKPGYYEVNWNAASQRSGVYFYQLTAGDFVKVKKMILLR